MTGRNLAPADPPTLTPESARLLLGILRAAYNAESAGGVAVSPSRQTPTPAPPRLPASSGAT